MVFDLELTLTCEGVKDSCIEAVFGSDDIDIKSGEIMKINTLFPSPPDPDTGDIKGGIVLIKLKRDKNIDYNKLNVYCSYQNKFGKKFKNTEPVILKHSGNQENDGEYYANLGVRKGILLTRYVLLMKQWIKTNSNGYTLKVSDQQKKIFKSFISYFQQEMKMCNDETLKQEITLMEKLVNFSGLSNPFEM